MLNDRARDALSRHGGCLQPIAPTDSPLPCPTACESVAHHIHVRPALAKTTAAVLLTGVVLTGCSSGKMSAEQIARSNAATSARMTGQADMYQKFADLKAKVDAASPTVSGLDAEIAKATNAAKAAPNADQATKDALTKATAAAKASADSARTYLAGLMDGKPDTSVDAAGIALHVKDVQAKQADLVAKEKAAATAQAAWQKAEDARIAAEKAAQEAAAKAAQEAAAKAAAQKQAQEQAAAAAAAKKAATSKSSGSSSTKKSTSGSSGSSSTKKTGSTSSGSSPKSSGGSAAKPAPAPAPKPAAPAAPKPGPIQHGSQFDPNKAGTHNGKIAG